MASYGRRSAQIDLLEGRAEAHEVAVRVVQAGNHRAAAGVDDARLRALHRQRAGVVADEHDAAAAADQGLRLRAGRVHGVDDGVVDDEVGGVRQALATGASVGGRLVATEAPNEDRHCRQEHADEKNPREATS